MADVDADEETMPLVDEETMPLDHEETTSTADHDDDDHPHYRHCCGLYRTTEKNLTLELIEVLAQHPLLILFGLCLLIAALLFLTLEQGLHFVTACYVMMQIVTTIGWGDVTVNRQGAQVAMAIIVLLSLIFIAKIISLFVDVLLARQDRRTRKALRYMESGFQSGDKHAEGLQDYKARKRWEKINRFLGSMLVFALFIFAGTLFYSLVEYCTCSYGVSQVIGCSRGPDRKDMDLCIETGGYVMTWINAFYFSVITLTTVGFGDYSPHSFEGRLFAIPWAIMGVLSTGVFISATADLLSPEQDMAIQDLQEIDEDRFKAIDEDRNGYLSKMEFRIWSLLERGAVDKELIDAIDAKYDVMDKLSPGDGKVYWEDIQRTRQQDIAMKEEVEERSGCFGLCSF